MKLGEIEFASIVLALDALILALPVHRALELNGPFLMLSLETWFPFFLAVLCLMICFVRSSNRVTGPLQVILMAQFVVLSLTPNIVSAAPWRWQYDAWFLLAHQQVTLSHGHLVILPNLPRATSFLEYYNRFPLPSVWSVADSLVTGLPLESVNVYLFTVGMGAAYFSLVAVLSNRFHEQSALRYLSWIIGSLSYLALLTVTLDIPFHFAMPFVLSAGIIMLVKKTSRTKRYLSILLATASIISSSFHLMSIFLLLLVVWATNRLARARYRFAGQIDCSYTGGRYYLALVIVFAVGLLWWFRDISPPIVAIVKTILRSFTTELSVPYIQTTKLTHVGSFLEEQASNIVLAFLSMAGVLRMRARTSWSFLRMGALAWSVALAVPYFALMIIGGPSTSIFAGIRLLQLGAPFGACFAGYALEPLNTRGKLKGLLLTVIVCGYATTSVYNLYQPGGGALGKPVTDVYELNMARWVDRSWERGLVIRSLGRAFPVLESLSLMHGGQLADINAVIDYPELTHQRYPRGALGEGIIAVSKEYIVDTMSATGLNASYLTYDFTLPAANRIYDSSGAWVFTTKL